MFELVLWDDEGEGCTFYSCLEEENTSGISLTDRFYYQFGDDPVYSEDLNVIDEVIEVIAKKGALDTYFRPEGRVEALPPKPRQLEKLGLAHFITKTGLRLYAFRLTQSVVILFDGERKTADKNQDRDSLVSMKWQDATIKSQHILRAMESGEFRVEGKYLLDDKGAREGFAVY